MDAQARARHLLLLLGIMLLISLLRPFWGPQYDLFFDYHFNSQSIHLRQIDEHIQTIRPQWNAFTNQNTGFELVQLFAFTGSDGMFAAEGVVPTNEHLKKLKVFMEGTKPPRPIFLGMILATNPESFDILKKSRLGHKR